MKKFAILGLVLCFMLMSGAALAQFVDKPAVETDGANLVLGANMVVIDLEGYTSGSPRYFNLGEAWGNQTATVEIPTSAMIPCHLELTFQGNDMNASLHSFGPDSAVSFNGVQFGGQNYIAFHPAVGGYLQDWLVIPGSNNNKAEVEPGEGIFIRACDTYKSVIWSNMNWKYSVVVPNGGLLSSEDLLPVTMRTATFRGDAAVPALSAVTAAQWSETVGFDNEDAEQVVIADGVATEEATVYQQFRVPFNRTIKAGHYTGSIQFIAETR